MVRRVWGDSEGLPQFGLVAEDVAKGDPDLWCVTRKANPLTVRYQEVTAMLLNEFLKEHRKVGEETRMFSLGLMGS